MLIIIRYFWIMGLPLRFPPNSSIPSNKLGGSWGIGGFGRGMKNKRNMGLQKAKKILKFPNLT